MRSDLRVKLSDGTVVGYAEAGDPAGSPMIYLHGSPSSRLEVGLPGIRETAEDLGLRVLAPDRPGVGLSTVPPLFDSGLPAAGPEFRGCVGARAVRRRRRVGRRQVRLRLRLGDARPGDAGRARVLDLFVRSAGSPGDVDQG